MARWRDVRGIDLKLLTDRAYEVYDPKGSGSRVIDFYEVALVLDSAIEFKTDIPEGERQQLLINALRTAAALNQKNQKTLLTEINKEERKFTKLPQQRYLIASSLSLDRNGNWRIATRFMGCRITLSGSHPTPIRKAREGLRQPRIPDEDVLPAGHTAVQIRTQGRSPHEAAEKALRSLDLLRSFWNLRLNSSVAQIHAPPDKPVNRIRIGRVHSIHLKDGKLAFDGYYVEPAFPRDRSTYADQKKFAALRTFEKSCRRKLGRIAFRRDLEDSLVRYVRALDGVDFDSVLLKLWGLLELLTSTDAAKHDQTTRRAAFLWTESDWARLVLEHLRERRNAHVHAGLSSQEAQRMVWQLERYVEQLLLFHLDRGGSFGSLTGVAEFLDMKTDVSELRRRAKLLSSAIKFRSP